MSIFQAIVLGVVQGATEFLPISSTAHLVLVPRLLGWNLDPDVRNVFDVLIQVGTILAAAVYFRRDWWKIVKASTWVLRRHGSSDTEYARLGWMIVLATVPSAIFGLLLKDVFEELLGNAHGVAFLLIVTSGLLVLGERFTGKSKRGLGNLTWIDAVVIGLFQALAILPGISRSGSTVSAGLLRGLERPAAARFSFLMAVPVMLGAGSVAGWELLLSEELTEHIVVISVGVLVSTVVGFLSIQWLISYLTRHSFRGFAIYCSAVGLAFLMSSCSSTPVRPEESKMRIGFTPATKVIVASWTEYSPNVGDIELVPYSSNRQLVRAIESGGVVAGIAIQDSTWFSLTATPLALTSLMVFVHPSNTVEELSLDQLQSAFTGTLTDWKDAGGSGGPIEVVSREDGSDARLAFDATILNGQMSVTTSVVMPGDDLMSDYVARTPSAVGYGWLPYLGHDVKTIVVDHALLSTMPVQALTDKEPNGQLRKWLAWVQTDGQSGMPLGFEPLP